MKRFLFYTVVFFQCSYSWGARLAVVDSNIDVTSPYLSSYVLSSESFNLNDGSTNVFSPAAFDPEAFTNYVRLNELNDRLNDEEILGKDENQERIQLATKPSLMLAYRDVQSFIHGTHVAGIATQNSSHNLIAMKWNNESLFSYSLSKFEKELLGENNLSPEEKVQRFVRKRLSFLKKITIQLQQSKADVANFSWGMNNQHLQDHFCSFAGYLGLICSSTEPLYQTFLLEMKTVLSEFFQENKETIFVIASGNEATDLDQRPNLFSLEKFENLILVGALNNKGHRAPFSNYGKRSIDVYCPGVAIPSVITGSRIMKLSGTSMAAPFAANRIGTIVDRGENSKADLIKELVESSSCRIRPPEKMATPPGLEPGSKP